MTPKRELPRSSALRADLYEATGRRLRDLGVGVLIFLTLVAICAFVFVMRLSAHIDKLSADAVALISFATLAGIGAVVRSMPSVLRAVATILDAKKPDTAGLVIYGNESKAKAEPNDQ